MVKKKSKIKKKSDDKLLMKYMSNMIYSTLLLLCMLFYAISSYLILNENLNSFEVMVSGLIFFATLISSTYILFTKINLNSYFFMGIFLIWVEFLCYNLDLPFIQEVGFVFVFVGGLIGFLELLGIRLSFIIRLSKLDASRGQAE